MKFRYKGRHVICRFRFFFTFLFSKEYKIQLKQISDILDEKIGVGCGEIYLGFTKGKIAGTWNTRNPIIFE